MTNIVDEGIVKCKQYWPDIEGDMEQYGSIQVQLDHKDVYAFFTVYKLIVQRQSGHGPARYCSPHHWKWRVIITMPDLAPMNYLL